MRSRYATGVMSLLLVMATACGSGDAAPPESSRQPNSTTAAAAPSPTVVDPLAVDDVDAATRTLVLEELAAAVEKIQAQPVEVTLEMTEDGEPRTAMARVDHEAQLLEATLESPLRSGSVVTTRNVVVDGRAFLKSTTSAEAEAALDYTEIPFDPVGAELLDEVFAGYARVNTSLGRIVALLENVPFAAQVSSVDGGTEIAVVMSPQSIVQFYRESGLEAVGGSIPPERTKLAFLIQDGVLRGLVADGTQFHNGEALDVAATITYTPIEPFTLEIPRVEE